MGVLWGISAWEQMKILGEEGAWRGLTGAGERGGVSGFRLVFPDTYRYIGHRFEGTTRQTNGFTNLLVVLAEKNFCLKKIELM